jgi:hypothetical protein
LLDLSSTLADQKRSNKSMKDFFRGDVNARKILTSCFMVIEEEYKAMFEQVNKPVSQPEVKLIPKPEVKTEQNSQKYSEVCEQLEALMSLNPIFCAERA